MQFKNNYISKEASSIFHFIFSLFHLSLKKIFFNLRLSSILVFLIYLLSNKKFSQRKQCVLHFYQNFQGLEYFNCIIYIYIYTHIFIYIFIFIFIYICIHLANSNFYYMISFHNVTQNIGVSKT